MLFLGRLPIFKAMRRILAALKPFAVEVKIATWRGKEVHKFGFF